MTVDRLEHYQLLQVLARGGYTEILLGRRDGPGSFVLPIAIKRLQPAFREELVHRRALIAEARVASLLTHPGVVRYLDLVEQDRELFAVMEYLHGRSARELIRALEAARVLMPIPAALHITARVLAALHHAHRAGDERGTPLRLVHRDISPENVFVCRDGNVKLLDFGIARTSITPRDTEIHRLKGKARYMSPEQASGEQLEASSDIFSTGLLLFELLTHRPGLAGDTPQEQLSAARDGRTRDLRVLRPEIPPELEAIVRRATSARPRERHESALALMHELRHLAAKIEPTFSEFELAKLIERCFCDDLNTERKALWKHQSTAVVQGPTAPTPKATRPTKRARYKPERSPRTRTTTPQPAEKVPTPNPPAAPPNLDRLLQVVEDTYE